MVSPPGKRSRSKRLALSTGRVARYCLVSPDTIANWISSGRLVAQRTAGGQWRIRVSDLRCFMKAHGMSTDLLDAELDAAEYVACWDFWAGLTGPGQENLCTDCPIYRSRAEVCHELRPLLPGGTRRAQSCSDCKYLESIATGIQTGEPHADHTQH